MVYNTIDLALKPRVLAAVSPFISFSVLLENDWEVSQGSFSYSQKINLNTPKPPKRHPPSKTRLFL
jgi:hypothetical protein